MNRSLGVLVAVVFFLFGAGALYVLASKGFIVVNMQPSPSPSAMVVMQPTPTPVMTPAASIVPSPVSSPSPSPTAKPKTSIEGTLSYPAEGIPPLDVFAINTIDNTKNASVSTGQNVSTFAIVVEPGTYYVVAYPKGNNQLSGGYTKAVACGLSVDCKDHTLIPVVVASGKTVSNIEVKDWYAPAGTYPPKP